jgi:hypothetical protein
VAAWAGAAILFAVPVALAFQSGGYDVQDQILVAAVLFLPLAVLALLAPWPLLEPGPPRWALAALLALAAWTALSIAWAPVRGAAADDADRLVMYAAAFALALCVMRLPRIRDHAPDTLLAGIVVVAGYALATRLLPDLVPSDPTAAAGPRLDQPLTYWNAVGVLMAFGVVLAISVAGNERRPSAYRAAACAAAVPCAIACLLTLSRGSWFALGAGALVLLSVRPRGPTLAAAVAAGGATLAVALSLLVFRAPVTLDRGESAQSSQGAIVLVLLLAAAIVAALIYPRLLGSPLAERRWRPRPALALAIVPAVFAVAAALSLSAEQTERLPNTPARVVEPKTLRGDYWRIALDAFAEDPLKGTGAGGFRAEWRRERDEPQSAVDAHSLYVETLSELGLVGALLLSALFGAVLAGLARRARAVPDDPLLGAGAAVLAAFAVHAGVDWDWEMPSVTLPALALAAAAAQPPAQRADRCAEAPGSSS